MEPMTGYSDTKKALLQVESCRFISEKEFLIQRNTIFCANKKLLPNQQAIFFQDTGDNQDETVKYPVPFDWRIEQFGGQCRLSGFVKTFQKCRK